jgi:pyrimidine deaminase RibD-like protein/GNAT superfamily N-acetyltransferase
MILTDLFESQEIHNQDRLDQVLARCIEMVHEKNHANPKKYGKVAACIIDMKNRKVFGINLPGVDGRRRHAERVAIDAYHKRYGKILPGAIIVTTLSPCNRPMAERDGPSCQDLLLQAGIEKVYSGYMDPSQHSEHPFTEETTKNDDLWRQCKELSDSFVHDDLTEGKIKLYTDPGHYGAELDNYKATGAVVNIPVDQLVGFEPDAKMAQPKSKANVEKIIAGLKKGDDIPPILVRKHKGGYQILDGHHRFRAYKLLKQDTIPAQIVPAKDIQEVGKQDVAENFADGKKPVKFTVTTPDGYTHSFQITLTVHGKHVGHFNFVRGADTDDVNNEAEVESRWQGQGYGKLLLMKAIDVANNHGLDFQQDIRGITDAQQNVYDSLENAGSIVTPGDGFWFLTPQGEQELNGLNENFADGKNPQDKGDAKRHGINTKASVSSLRKTAKQGGRKGQLAHWLANMKAGRAKAKRK